MVKAVVCCGKFPHNIETMVHRCFIHTSEFAVLVETKRYVSLSVCGAGDGGENPAFWYIPVRRREYASGRSWTAWDHKRHTQTEWERVKELLSPALNTKKKQKTTTENPVPLLFLRGNTTRTRTRLRTETFNGAIVSGTWPDPDPFYTTKLLEVCQSHTHTHTHRRWRATLVLLGCYPNFYPCCSWDYFLTWND